MKPSGWSQPGFSLSIKMPIESHSVNSENSTNHSARFLASSLAAALLAACLSPSAEAKIGEPIVNFKAKVAKEYQFKGTESKGASTYYRFALIPTQEEQDNSPGFGAGMTITVVNGKVSGQSMALRIGQFYEAGKIVVARRSLKFILEAIGKPATPQDEERLLESIRSAIEQALQSIPQSIQFPGYNHRVKVSFAASGDVIVAVLPPAPQQPTSPLAPPGSYLR